MRSARPSASPGTAESTRRIETQIHRRKKAKPVPPLEAEWEQGDGTAAPERLRMPANQMEKGR